MKQIKKQLKLNPDNKELVMEIQTDYHPGWRYLKAVFYKIHPCFLGILCGFIPQMWLWAEALEHAQKETTGNGGFYALSAAIAISVAAFGGALGQGRVGASAMEGIARNPQAQKIMFIPMIIVLALIESFVIFSLAISMILVGKI